MITIVCKDCGTNFTNNGGRGRPPVRCESCRGIVPSDPPAKTEIQSVQEVSKSEGPSPEVLAEKEKEYHIYMVHVTNLGYSYKGDDATAAQNSYKHYQGMSERGFGQCGHETVTLYVNGVISMQWKPGVSCGE